MCATNRVGRSESTEGWTKSLWGLVFSLDLLTIRKSPISVNTSGNRKRQCVHVCFWFLHIETFSIETTCNFIRAPLNNRCKHHWYFMGIFSELATFPCSLFLKEMITGPVFCYTQCRTWMTRMTNTAVHKLHKLIVQHCTATPSYYFIYPLHGGFVEHSCRSAQRFLVILEGVCLMADVSNICYLTLNVILLQKHGMQKKSQTG